MHFSYMFVNASLCAYIKHNNHDAITKLYISVVRNTWASIIKRYILETFIEEFKCKTDTNFFQFEIFTIKAAENQRK